MTQCIPSEEGVVHGGHYFYPQDEETEQACGGVLFPDSKTFRNDAVEKRFKTEYCLARWSTIDDIPMLYRTVSTQDLDEVRKWLSEMDEDFKPDSWFIIKDVSEIYSFRIG